MMRITRNGELVRGIGNVCDDRRVWTGVPWLFLVAVHRVPTSTAYI